MLFKTEKGSLYLFACIDPGPHLYRIFFIDFFFSTFGCRIMGSACKPYFQSNHWYCLRSKLVSHEVVWMAFVSRCYHICVEWADCLHCAHFLCVCTFNQIQWARRYLLKMFTFLTPSQTSKLSRYWAFSEKKFETPLLRISMENSRGRVNVAGIPRDI